MSILFFGMEYNTDEGMVERWPGRGTHCPYFDSEKSTGSDTKSGRYFFGVASNDYLYHAISKALFRILRDI